MSETTLLAVGQIAPSRVISDNLAAIRSLALEVGASGARMLLLPELSVTGWGESPQDFVTLPQPLDGEVLDELQAISRDSGLTLVAGLYERSDNADDRPFNTLVAVDPERGLIARHRKMHLYDAFGYCESDEVQPGGDELNIMSIDGLKVGLINCYEVRFPERAYRLAEAGCNVLAVGAAWPTGPFKEEHWSLNIRARAVENQVWVLGSSSCGDGVIGRSLAVDPFGLVRAQLDETAGQWAAVPVSEARNEHARRTLPVRRQREQHYYA